SDLLLNDLSPQNCIGDKVVLVDLLRIQFRFEGL
ncbi:MAG: hypothetical protein QG657_3, partial [Acidobacteriota bacterium]|nr:hypothetical protein [Acidobacteriota bacterium]